MSVISWMILVELEVIFLGRFEYHGALEWMQGNEEVGWVISCAAE